MDYSFFALNFLYAFNVSKGFLIWLFNGVMKGRNRAISRHMEGQESSDSDPCQGKLQKDLDYAHIPMYAFLVVKHLYIHAYRFKSCAHHFSYVFRDDQGNIKGQKVVHGV